MDINTTLQRNLRKLNRLKGGAIKGLLRTLKHVETEKKKRTADLDEAAAAIIKELQLWGHKVDSSPTFRRPKKLAKDAFGRLRKRRTAEEIKKEAQKIVAFIKAAKDGRTGSEIHRMFPDMSAGMTIKNYVLKHCGVKLKTKGEKSKMVYHA